MKGLDNEIKALLDYRVSLERIISIFTAYTTENYDRLKKEVLEELKKEFNME